MLGTMRHCSRACLVLILCFPHQCLCSSSLRYSSFSTPSAPGSVPHSYFVWRWTEINKGKSNIKCAVCSRIYASTRSSILKYTDEMRSGVLHYIFGYVVAHKLLHVISDGVLHLSSLKQPTSAALRRAKSFTSSVDTVLLLACLK